MTASQSCKSVRRVCCLLTSHDTARPDIRLSLQIVQPLLEFDPRNGLFVSRFIAVQLVGSAQSNSVNSPMALKPP
jgi:hypothetical protein